MLLDQTETSSVVSAQQSESELHPIGTSLPPNPPHTASQPLSISPEMQCSLPGTPHTTSLHSLLAIGSSTISQPSTDFKQHIQGPLKGTPSAVGAIQRCKSLSSIPFNPTPLWHHLSISPGDSQLSDSQGCNLLVKQNKVLICKTPQISFDNLVEVECEEFKHNEGQFLLDIARVQFKMHHLEQALAEAKLEETIILGSLYKCQAHKAERRLECIKFDLGSSIDTTGTWSQNCNRHDLEGYNIQMDKSCLGPSIHDAAPSVIHHVLSTSWYFVALLTISVAKLHCENWMHTVRTGHVLCYWVTVMTMGLLT
ncbi:hypothetical protein J3A83DRAFT_4196370 [Scleroderma citrinum]